MSLNSWRGPLLKKERNPDAPSNPRGEVFANVGVGGSDNSLECRFYRALDVTAPGCAVIPAVRLVEQRPFHSPVSTPINTEQSTEPVANLSLPLLSDPATSAHEPPLLSIGTPPECVKFKCAAQRERVLGVTAIAFFGIRDEDADGLITLRGEEVEAARVLAETGHFKTNVAGMRRTPLGNTPLNAPIVADSLASKASPTAVNVAPVRSMRRRGHFANQVKALIYKDFLVMKASKWAFWCELLIAIFMVLVVAMLLLFIVRPPMSTDDVTLHFDGRTLLGRLRSQTDGSWGPMCVYENDTVGDYLVASNFGYCR